MVPSKFESRTGAAVYDQAPFWLRLLWRWRPIGYWELIIIDNREMAIGLAVFISSPAATLSASCGYDLRSNGGRRPPLQPN